MVRPPTPHTSQELRSYAATCWLWAESPAAAAAFFRQKYPDAVRRPGEFCKKWGLRLRETSTVADAPGRGRRCKVSEADARRGAAIMMAGPPGRGSGVGFTSIQHALEHSPELRNILERSRVTPATLLRHMRRAQPNLVQRALRFRPPLSQKNRKLRLQLAKRNRRLLHDQPAYWRRVIWLDAKKLWVRPEGGLVWTDRRRPLPILSYPGYSSSGRAQLLHYYAAVQADLGPIGIVFVTGTPGQLRVYTVSGRVGWLGWWDTACLPATSAAPLSAHHLLSKQGIPDIRAAELNKGSAWLLLALLDDSCQLSCQLSGLLGVAVVNA
jgi:hypothetical protein